MKPRARLSGRAAWRPEGSGCLIYDIGTDVVTRGNAQSRLVLEGCEARRPVAAIARDLHTRYGVAEARAAEDVTRFLDGLVAAGLAEWADGPA